MSRFVSLTLLSLALPCVALAQPGAGTFEQVGSFGANPGALQMHRYIPSPAPGPGAPVVVALHGCTQNVTTYRNAGWEPVADELGFYVVYPAQVSGNNPVSCFNWAGEYGDEANLRRGQGENQSIVSMVDQMQADFGTDPSRVFIMGHSAGAAMAMVMLSTWPDRFAAGGVIAGIPYRCATSVAGAFSCQSPGVDKTPDAWADLVRAASSYGGPWPRLSVWHGTNDGVVSPNNQRELLEQWTALHGLAATPDATETVDGYPRSTFGGGAIESWEITGAGHATFVDPDHGCGATASYISDADICAVRHMATFFGLGGGPGMPPPSGDAGLVGLMDGGTPSMPPPGTDAGAWSWGGRDGGTSTPMGGDPGQDPGHDPVACGGCSVGAPGATAPAWLAALALLVFRRRR
ncbi:MAG: PHB depolymerase family esterase [Sandaracinaceae bacterium]|nr:PHB depolymerase family esterase [Sandaracinaceae bacterium]